MGNEVSTGREKPHAPTQQNHILLQLYTDLQKTKEHNLVPLLDTQQLKCLRPKYERLLERVNSFRNTNDKTTVVIKNEHGHSIDADVLELELLYIMRMIDSRIRRI